MQAHIVGNCDFSRLHAMPMTKNNGKKRVDLFMDDMSTAPGNKIKFQICQDETKPVITKYPLDQVRDDTSDPTRRGQVCLIEDPKDQESLIKLDDRIVELGVQNSKEWFGKPLTEEQVRLRYKNCLTRDSDDSDYNFKFKVKCTGAAWPTKIFRKSGPDSLVPTNESALSAKNAKIVAIVSAYGIYFISGDAQFGVSFQAEHILVVEEGVASSATGAFSLTKSFKVVPPPDQEGVDVALEGDGDVPPKRMKTENVLEEGESAMGPM